MVGRGEVTEELSPLRARVLETVVRRIHGGGAGAATGGAATGGATTGGAGAPTRVAIDGVDGAGKTVFADQLAGMLRERGHETIRVSVDGFHNPRAVRHRRGRDSPLGFYLDSYDLEALRVNVLAPLGPGGDRRVVSAVHDVEREEPVTLVGQRVPDDAVLVLDGIFLHRPELRPWWHLSVFLEVPFEVSVPRGNARFGGDPDPDAASNRRYVEGQRHYLATCRPRRHATFVIDNGDLAAPRILAER